jgi:hypothetical protein
MYGQIRVALIVVAALAVGVLTGPAAHAAPAVARSAAAAVRPGAPTIKHRVIRVMPSDGHIGVPSCPTAHFCATAETHGYVDMWNGHRWTTTEVDRTSDAGLPRLTVACPTATWCLAVDATLHAFTWSRGAWSPASTIASSPAEAIAPELSCASTTFCVVVTDSGEATAFDGRAWQPPQSLGRHASDYQLSCPAVDYCVAIGSDTSRVFDGSSWSAPYPMSSNQSDVFGHLSCATPTSCFADGYFGAVAHWDGSTWTPVVGAPSGYSLGSVDCPLAQYCVIDGQTYNDNDSVYTMYLDHGVWSTPALTQALWLHCWSRVRCIAGLPATTSSGPMSTRVLANGQWRAPQAVATKPYVGMQDLSCARTGFCMAVATDNRYTVYRRGSWSAMRSVTGELGGMWTVRCVSATFCMAIDLHDDALAWNGRTWRNTGRVGRSTIAADCVSANFCVALDSGLGTARIFNGHRWSTPVVVDAKGEPISVSCPTATFCMATDAFGHAFSYRHGHWSKPTVIADDMGGPVSCASATFCVASVLDYKTLGVATVRYYNGRSWGPVVVMRWANVDRIDCPAVGVCVAYTNDGFVYEFTPSRVGRYVATAETPVQAMSCRSATVCHAIWEYGTFAVRFAG